MIGDECCYDLIVAAVSGLYWTGGNVDRAVRLTCYSAATERSTGTGLAKMNREFVDFYPETLTTDPALATAYAEGQRLTVQQVTALALRTE